MKKIRLLSSVLILLTLSSARLLADSTWDRPASILFTAQTGGQFVTVIDVARDRVVGRVQTAYPIDDIAASGFGDYAFAGHALERKVSVINLRQQVIERVVSVSVSPRHLTFEQNSGLVMTDSVAGGIAVLDVGGQRELFANRDIPPSRDVIFGPTGVVAYYHAGEAGIVGAVSAVDGRSLWQSRVPTSQDSVPLVRSLDGLFILVVQPDAGQVHALLAASGQAMASQHFGAGLSRPYVTANGQYFLVADAANRQVHVLAQNSFTRLFSVVTEEPVSLVTSGLFDVMAVAYGNSELYALDLLQKTAQPAHVLPLKGAATDVIVTSDSRHAYAAIPTANAIAHLNLSSGELSYIEGVQRPDIVTMGVSNAVCH